ncbi:hypothetical protein RR48_01626 [Papilio machaon]|uniref:BCL2/adenovirus E1B 19 kDa protein-interacting protein 3 n=1 Tax=Papilio machaon TaxID=76193 RepID=A0A0N0PCK9_PAPMA|nr:hypothetical protein RR48_01626 [Papilio machaon]
MESKSLVDDNVDESWVELNSGGGLAAMENEYIRLLREAQRESRDSSVRHSRASSVKGSPKSPPNSPNLEPSTEDELKGIYINCWRDDSNDWVWEWSSRPDQLPPNRGAIAAVLVTNIVSLLLGAGIGVWLSKRGILPPRLIILN